MDSFAYARRAGDDHVGECPHFRFSFAGARGMLVCKKVRERKRKRRGRIAIYKILDYLLPEQKKLWKLLYGHNLLIRGIHDHVDTDQPSSKLRYINTETFQYLRGNFLSSTAEYIRDIK